MKSFYLFFIASTFGIISSWGQIKTTDIILNNGSSYSKVFDYSSSAKLKHLNAKEWIAKTFGDYKSVLQFEDEDNYKLIIKGFSNLMTENSNGAGGLVTIVEKPKMNFVLTIDCKDDRYRVKIEDISFDVNTKFTLLGNTNNSSKKYDYYGFTKNDSLTYALKIADVYKKIKDLESVDLSSLKKKELKKHNEELAAQQKLLVSETEAQKKQIIKAKGRAILVQSTICDLMNSLCEAIEKKDDF
ncbi:DUF4468 domain-containing protein [Bacteroides faecis]|jgi:hypothetical protein|uniref:DUF4468 domain-containing protein n=1 Tax=Bacteroides faecis TaxID=674529 RepID=UPI001020295C|nr:DUF4468 domain-containing protein [Bacteroides faecis]KAA5261851.1 DUF4468 domain-containing protein [Bacteroides faecis]RYT79505.1 DUF4468 domain-containing protein [Bacteroides faecis]DAL38210.1 MAG TPA_asm: hypothetical protein [Bacteriophage sp.]